MQFSVTYKLHVFLIPYDNYQYISHVLVCGTYFFYLRTVYIHNLFHNTDRCLLFRARTLIRRIQSFFAFIHVNRTIAWLLFLFRREQIISLALNSIRTRSFFIFIRFLVARSSYVYAFQFLILNYFVDVSYCFVDISNFFLVAWFNSFGTYPNVPLTFNFLSNMFD